MAEEEQKDMEKGRQEQLKKKNMGAQDESQNEDNCQMKTRGA